VHGQVRDQVYDQVNISRWSNYVAGNLWASYYAWLDYYQTIGVTGLDPIAGQMQVASAAAWWWPMRDVCILTDRPDTIHGEQVAPAGWSSHRLHCEDGPALHYRDGWAIYAWHGTRVPADLIEEGWDTDRIMREPNAEIRRCAIERLGWPRFVADAGLTQVGGNVDDPGNSGQTLGLYDVPAQIFEEPVRVLLCSNATVERDGERHQFGLTVPANLKDPVAAAAWSFGISRKKYAALQRAC